MYTIYEAKISDEFAGDGIETLVCKDGMILAHVRGWKNQQVVENFKGNLTGKPESRRGKGWHKLTGLNALCHQTWAAELIDYKKMGMV